MQTIALWLFVINLGIAFGAGIYEHRIVVPRLISSSPESGVHWNAEAARTDDSGRRFWAFVSTLPLTLLTLANLFFAWRSTRAIRGLVACRRACRSPDHVLYFIPTMIRLMEAIDSPAAAAAATRWANLNYLRHAFVLVAWLAALKALRGR